MTQLQPQFFDIFGCVGLAFIAIVAVLMLRRVRLPKWVPAVLLLIGIIGLVVDGIIVYVSYLK